MKNPFDSLSELSVDRPKTAIAPAIATASTPRSVSHQCWSRRSGLSLSQGRGSVAVLIPPPPSERGPPDLDLRAGGRRV